MSSSILIETRDHIRIVRIDRPEQKNALTHEMYTIMADTLVDAQEDPDVRCVLFTGSSECFTAGNDLSEFAQGMPDTFVNTPVGRFLFGLANSSKPIVAAVNGPAVGIGTTMLLHCDLAFAGDNTRFQMPFVNLGLCPEGGSSLLLPRWMGRVKATELLMLGRPFDANEAESFGLINAVCPAPETENRALEACERLCAQPPAAIRATRQLINQAQNEALHETMLAEGELFAHRLESPEATEAFTAFREKRKPDYSRFE